MSFKDQDQCLYWHNYFRTLHQVNTRDSLVEKNADLFFCEGVGEEEGKMAYELPPATLLYCSYIQEKDIYQFYDTFCFGI